MGIIIRRSEANLAMVLHHKLPVIFDAMKSEERTQILNMDFVQFSLNSAFAAALLNYPVSERLRNALHVLSSSIPAAASLLLTDYEMLFDPRYEIDPMQLFCDLARHKALAVSWCGKLQGGTLVYSEPGYPEYRQYSISECSVICIV